MSKIRSEQDHNLLWKFLNSIARNVLSLVSFYYKKKSTPFNTKGQHNFVQLRDAIIFFLLNSNHCTVVVPLRRKIRFCDDIVYSEKEIMAREKAAGVVSGGGRFMWHCILFNLVNNSIHME